MAGEVENKGDDELVDSLANDHLPYADRDERGGFGGGFVVEYIFCGSFSSRPLHELQTGFIQTPILLWAGRSEIIRPTAFRHPGARQILHKGLLEMLAT